MTDFVKYQHVVRFGDSETGGITDGVVYIFPKIDGTNGSVWASRKMSGIALGFGSRNRELDLENDNAGFMNSLVQEDKYREFFKSNLNLRLYGEWLVPHSLKTYREAAWRRFYVFDVQDVDTGQMLSYDEYQPLLEEFNIDYIPPLVIIKNPSDEDIFRVLEKCGQFLVEDGKGLGEGIVLKNYFWENKYGRQTWAKIITNEFKEKHHKEMGAPLVNGSLLVEEAIVSEFVTEHFVLKEKAKIEVELGSWEMKYIPRLLGVVFHELITEEIWNILKIHKNPKINFGLLQKMTIAKVKKVIGL